MKNQYFGDINDYRKYGLLRALQRNGNGKLLVAWMLTHDDGGRDGSLRAYLDRPEIWAKYDPELFAGLAHLLGSATQPSVSLIEATSLLPRASYHSAVVPDDRRGRDLWREGLLCAASGTDLVFVDPDNGIEVTSKPVGRKDSAKYVTWSEIEALWNLRCSILIYQHFRREPREPFASRMAWELRDHSGAPWVEALRTPHVLFLLAAQERHEAQLREALALVHRRWSGQIEPMGLSQNRMQ
jgi:hypothetical protein